MTDLNIAAAQRAGPTQLRGQHERLREAAPRFKGVFIAQLFREMRATIPSASTLDPRPATARS